MTAALTDRFRAYCETARLFPAPGTALVAVSGGADSVALLDLLQEAGPALGLALVVAHADHGIRSDSRTVGQSVQRLAERYGLPFELGELGLGPGTTETLARRARYVWLRAVQARRHARYLVTAHHGDDQVETVLLRVLRGSAPAGLAGMPARTRGGLVRPLLPFTHAELVAYASERGLPVHDDPANRDPAHLRSWIRGTLVPLLLARLGPRVREDLLRVGRYAAAERRAWDRLLEVVPDLELHVAAHGFDVARAGLARYDDEVAVALVRAAARRVGGGLVLGPRRARALCALARRSSGRRLPLGGGWTAEVAFDRLQVRRPIGCAAEELVGAGERGSAQFGDFSLSWRPEPAPATLQRTAWTTWVAGADWAVRSPRPGDRVVPLGGVGRRALRRVLMDAHVPRSERGRYPVVTSGETILWVPGVCRSAAALPVPGTPAVRLDVIRSGESAEADR